MVFPFSFGPRAGTAAVKKQKIKLYVVVPAPKDESRWPGKKEHRRRSQFDQEASFTRTVAWTLR
jgi:hypothetical protein